jgi:putative zinc finger/helix-turn-helix YgiT family protein
MVSARENFSYKASGLPVTLVDVEVRRCKECGEFEVVIPRVDDLHRTIARAVIAKRSRLTPAEIRFLRTRLGWSGTDFARHMGVKAETVSRWENGHDQMSPSADRLLRLMVVTRQPVSDYSLDSLVNVDAAAKPTKVRAKVSKEGWEAAGLAA